MKIIDKAIWQIDGGVPEELVVAHFKELFLWLDRHEMLTDEGREELEDGIDDTASLNEELITSEALKFFEENYEKYLEQLSNGKYGKDTNGAEIEKLYLEYLRNL